MAADASGARRDWPSGDGWPDVREAREDGEHTLRLALWVSPEVSWFDGHFPGHPVLPGIVQLHWAVAFARAAWPWLGGARRVENLKFQAPVLPGAALSLRLELAPDGGRLRFAFDGADQPCSAGRVYFE